MKPSNEELYVGFKTNFAQGMTKATRTFESIATVIQSNTSIEKYPIFDQVPKMNEWAGPRRFEELKLKTLPIVNRDFELSVRVKRNAIEDDQYSLYGSQIESMGTSAGNIWDDLVFNALTTNPKWVDDVDFFSTTRAYKKGATIVNKATTALSLSAYELARATMMGYVGHGGEPLNVIPDTLIVGPANEKVARQILECETMVVDGVLVSNVFKGTAKLVVSTRLVGAHANKWFMMSSNDAIKPIICQKRKLPVLQKVDAEDSEAVIKHKENWYLTDARGEAALVIPHLIYAGGI